MLLLNSSIIELFIESAQNFNKLIAYLTSFMFGDLIYSRILS